MPHATVNGIDVHYLEAGEGFPILLIHGFTGNLHNWDLQVPLLCQEYRTILPDLRGHGHSAKPTRPEDYTLELMVEDVYGLVRHLGLAQCYLVGHSMGGMIAQRLILAYPEPFRALVLVDTAAEVPAAVRTPERERLREIARTQGMEAVFEEQLRNNPMADQMRAHPALVEMWRQEFLLTSREAYLYCAQGMANGKPLLHELQAIEAPTLIICGENDELFVEPSHRLHERIPSSELVIIQGAGHSPQMEQPDEFNRVLAGFLSRVRQSVAAGG